ncbi:SWIM zinc finger family protein [Chamaesiphon sp. OTE_75_metabat_556]|uniref:SWIM zinc finger family protein n=1 Tax=Chamaesiphon sp. OTE_75_metabat_556 TaxID=2964692 RepID=UPI00286B4D3A|nr:SWIM zinc finger family protein [Chamaesiphon sp. OTE_75_metabat_556]
MNIANLSETDLRYHATDKSFQRGEAYHQQGAVVDLCQRGNCLYGEVEGNNVEPYHVTIQFDAGGVTETECTCEYSFEGWCKHIVAVALTSIRTPETMHQRLSLNELLDRLNHVQTQTLVQELVAKEPNLLSRIDRFVNKISPPIIVQPVSTTETRPKRQTSVDPQPYRYQTKQLLRDCLRYWEEGEEENPIETDLPEILDQVQAWIDNGNGNDALVILAAITEACVEDWDELADYGADGQDLVLLLDPMWAAAVLTAELTSVEAIDIQVNLEEWQDRLNGEFEICAEALRQGWDAPELLAVLEGQSDDLWEDGRPSYADKLTRIRLEMLNLQERYPAYLHLALAEDLVEEYLVMLAQLGRIAEVMAASIRLKDAGQALAVAKVLRAQDALTEALFIAKSGLDLPDRLATSQAEHHFFTISQSPMLDRHRYELADWTSELAQGLGDTETALTARISAFKLRPSMHSYQQAKTLADDTWQTLQPDLLQHLRTMDNWSHAEAKVQIFLDAGSIDDAIATVNDGYGRGHLMQLVMDAAMSHRPEWVIAKAIRPAEDIINRGKAESYQEAVNWLTRARAAYIQSGRQAEWQAYRAQLVSTHGRKRKLVCLIESANL